MADKKHKEPNTDDKSNQFGVAIGKPLDSSDVLKMRRALQKKHKSDK